MEREKKRIVSFDLDMTLLDHKTWKIPESAMEAVELLRRDSVIVVGSGRNMDLALSVEYRDQIRPDAIIHMNGTRVTVKGKTLYEHIMDKERLRRLLAYGEERGIALGVSMENGDYYTEFKFPLFSGKMGADVVEKEASKAEGLKRLCQYYGMELGQTAAFGDSMNDYEIVSLAGTGIAMGNAVEELKTIADYVTDAVDQDGVWNACRHFGWI